MTSSSVKKLFRRCLLIVTLGVATGCTSLKQMPSSPVAVQERSFNTVTTPAIPDEIEVLSQTFPELVPSISKVPDKDFVLENPDTDSRVINYISERFKISQKLSKEIVELATEYAHTTFPKRNDILALIAVESTYDVNARSRGCLGLMQIEKKSHLKLIKGRSLKNPRVNIEVGSTVLNQYHVILKGNERGTVLSFNAGIGNFLKGRYKSEYHAKYQKERKLFSSL